MVVWTADIKLESTSATRAVAVFVVVTENSRMFLFGRTFNADFHKTHRLKNFCVGQLVSVLTKSSCLGDSSKLVYSQMFSVLPLVFLCDYSISG